MQPLAPQRGKQLAQLLPQMLIAHQVRDQLLLSARTVSPQPLRLPCQPCTATAVFFAHEPFKAEITIAGMPAYPLPVADHSRERMPHYGQGGQAVPKRTAESVAGVLLCGMAHPEWDVIACQHLDHGGARILGYVYESYHAVFNAVRDSRWFREAVRDSAAAKQPAVAQKI